MKNSLLMTLLVIALSGVSFSQTNNFEKFDFLLGEWTGTGRGFGNEESKIQSEFKLIMNGKYIQIKNNSKFEPTESKPKGEKHIDWGIVSFDKKRKKIIYRQFNSEGYVNQYVLNDSLSSASKLIFETELIENFAEGGRARWTIKKHGDNEIETIFDVSFPGKEFACFGTNKLTKK